MFFIFWPTRSTLSYSFTFCLVYNGLYSIIISSTLLPKNSPPDCFLYGRLQIPSFSLYIKIKKHRKGCFFIFWPTRRDLNPHSPESESVALSNCATDGYSAVFSYGFLYLINLKVLPKLHTVLPVHSAILRVYL